MDAINKLSLPATILIASVVLGGFYYASEANKTASIEKQQQIDLQAKQDEQQTITYQNNKVASQKASCVTEAQNTAVSEYKNSFCNGTYASNNSNCYNGTYLTVQYDNAYSTCLQRYGLK